MKTVIKVVGIGGAGGNAIDRMTECNLVGVDLIAVNTDVQDLKKIRAAKKLQIGKQSTKGLGAGMNPQLGKEAAAESREEIKGILAGADMIFLTAGLGGGTGGGAIPVVAELARMQRALVVGIVTKPFSFEGTWRARLAEQALGELEGKLDALLVIPNDKILSMAEQDTTVLSVFWSADEILREAVQGISDVIAKPGLINVDFADVRQVMKNAGHAMFGVGMGKGEKRVEEALRGAFHSPLLDRSAAGAKAVLFNVTGSSDLSLAEIQQIAQDIKKQLKPNAKIIFGAGYDRQLKNGELKITLIATGF
ncbi:MAG: cell division protein FtsZ [Candidatus Wildermuthbacteria bacterium]|nr:cell division protein FtsZ [Candidatus Wildermuthbacteria bacterium]